MISSKEFRTHFGFELNVKQSIVKYRVTSNHMRKKKIFINLICVFLFLVFGMSSTYINGEARIRLGRVKKCIFIIGDSRTCGINRALRTRFEDSEVYSNIDKDKRDAIYKLNDTAIILCAEAGGGYEDGSFDNSVERMWKLIDKYDAIGQAEEYIFYNLYGINDIIREPAIKNEYPLKYVAADRDIRNQLGEKCTKFYQFDVGPVYEDGWVNEHQSLNNQRILEYNSRFKGDEEIEIIRFNDMITAIGLDDFDDAPDDSGLHYSDRINEQIVKLIIALSEDE